MLFEELKLPLIGQKEASIKRTRRQQYSTSQVIFLLYSQLILRLFSLN
jgi:hypothetical protein